MKKTPNNLDEAIDYLLSVVSEEDKNVVRRSSSMNQFHHTVGQNLRNDWSLWHSGPLREWFISIGIGHADDMSGIILKAFRRKLLNQPYDLQEDVQKYKQFWEATKGKTKFRIYSKKNQYGETEYTYDN